MPPKKSIPEGFHPSPAGDGKVICDVCARVCPPGKPILKTSINIHLEAREHKRCVISEQQQAQERSLAESVRLERQRQQRDRLRTVSLPQTNLHLTQPEPQANARLETFWDEYDADPSSFHVDTDPDPKDTSFRERERIEKALNEFGDWDDVAMGYALGADRELDEEDLLAENRARDDERQVEDMLDALSADWDASETIAISDSDAWYPYASKLMFLLDAVDNLPRLRISESLMKLFLYILKEVGVKGVPSITALRKFQDSLRQNGSGVPSIRCTSVQDKIFYVNDIRKLVANDWCNPLIRPHIRVYPEIPENGVVSEIWHAEKWRTTMDQTLQSPMYDAGGGRHYFVNELAQLHSNQFVIPVRWVTCGGRVMADAFIVDVDDVGCATVSDTEQLIRAVDLTANFLDLQHQQRIPFWSISAVEAGFPNRMPNPDRKIANGRPLYTSLVNYFADDVSGNRSKSWNKHNNVYFSHANIPRELRHQEAHTHFISTSQHTIPAEQFREVKKLIVETHSNPIPVKDPRTNEESLVRLGVNVDSSDNPMQSEICSHIGDKGNFPCRKCEVGGLQTHKQSDDGYHAFFSEGPQRNKDKVIAAIKLQLQLACRGVQARVEENQTDTGVKDAYAQFWIQKILADAEARKVAARQHDPSKLVRDIREEVSHDLLQWVEEHFDDLVNPFLLLEGHDPVKDTPVEILHTILLGVVKYIWYSTHTPWKEVVQKPLYAQRLQSTDITGLNIPPIRAGYIMQYANSLIGRQLKTVIQTAVFHVHDQVDWNHYAGWKAVSQLSTLLWMPEIDNMDMHCADLKIAAGNVLDVFARIDPSKMIMKIKLHLLVHLPGDARAFGPLVGVATEIFESFNAVFRAASILSNHRAPSRDIARQLADQEGVRLRAFGGWWLDTASNEWRRAGPAVREYINKQPRLQKLMGWTTHEDLIPGSVTLAPLPPREQGKPRSQRPILQFCDTLGFRCVNVADFPQVSAATWSQCQKVVAQSGDSCPLNSWVFFNSPGGHVAPGKLLQILAPVVEQGPIVVLDCFEVAASKHTVYEMPQLVRRLGEATTYLVHAKDILFIFNAQHDCITGGCAATGSRQIEQERELTNISEAAIEHKGPDIFIINTSAFHNAHLLRRTLPRELTKPIPFDDEAAREREHHRHAATLRDTTKKKRKERESEASRKAKDAAAAKLEAERLANEAAEAARRVEDEERPTQRARLEDSE
ncbi:hypothetical protein GGX14DRAFT_573901 [Mycena pura]|uniref:Uncharacterized protein n=1 Tax=Mycena pura TaxID=153505 RepID=A0AAD6Y3R1_9AGAR|nr:hypothetical protein GGX14DRAFT_573901 [Mycena pura]